MSDTSPLPREKMSCFVCLADDARYKCEKCGIVRYCKKECQLLHLKSHKKNCREGHLVLNEQKIDKKTYRKISVGFGVCLDCVRVGKKDIETITYFCNRCHYPRICSDQEKECGMCCRCRNGWIPHVQFDNTLDDESMMLLARATNKTIVEVSQVYKCQKK